MVDTTPFNLVNPYNRLTALWPTLPLRHILQPFPPILDLPDLNLARRKRAHSNILIRKGRSDDSSRDIICINWTVPKFRIQMLLEEFVPQLARRRVDGEDGDQARTVGGDMFGDGGGGPDVFAVYACG